MLGLIENDKFVLFQSLFHVVDDILFGLRLFLQILIEIANRFAVLFCDGIEREHRVVVYRCSRFFVIYFFVNAEFQHQRIRHFFFEFFRNFIFDVFVKIKFAMPKQNCKTICTYSAADFVLLQNPFEYAGNFLQKFVASFSSVP